jgi:hypothetical protein
MEGRIWAFKKQFPEALAPQLHNGALYVCWVIGTLLGPKGELYGQYPFHLRERIEALFPDAKKAAHLFSGTIRPNPRRGTITYDMNPKWNPTICDSIMNIGRYVEEFEDVDLAMADPPYELADFQKYGCPPFNKAEAIRRIAKVLKPGAFLTWLDVRQPMYNGKFWTPRGILAISQAGNTRYRGLLLLQRTAVKSEL